MPSTTPSRPEKSRGDSPHNSPAPGTISARFTAPTTARKAEDAYRRGPGHPNPDLSEIWRNLGDLLCHPRRPPAGTGPKKDPLLRGRGPAPWPRAPRPGLRILLDQAHVPEAAAALRDLIDQSGCATVEDHWDASLLLLTAGDFKRGWKSTNIAGKCPAFPRPCGNSLPPALDRPGIDRQGNSHCTQSRAWATPFQFVRYAVLVKARGARVLLEAKEELVQVLTGAAGIDAVYARGAELPAFDFHCPLLSLPGNFGTTLETIPQKIGCLARGERHQQASGALEFAQQTEENNRGPRLGRPSHPLVRSSALHHAQIVRPALGNFRCDIC